MLLGEAWSFVVAKRSDAAHWAAARLALLLLLYAGVNVDRYFGQVTSDYAELIYAPELRMAIEVLNEEPESTHVSWAASQWGAHYEAVQYLSTVHSVKKGNLEDRSSQFGPAGQDTIEHLDQSRPSILMMLGDYTGADDYVREHYPGAQIAYGPLVLGRPAYVLVRFPARP